MINNMKLLKIPPISCDRNGDQTVNDCVIVVSSCEPLRLTDFKQKLYTGSLLTNFPEINRLKMLLLDSIFKYDLQ